MPPAIAAARALEARIRDEARTIATKYLAPPHTSTRRRARSPSTSR
jgi:DNA anti-recombination protein RmuC